MTDRVREDAERWLEDEIRRVKKLEAEHASSNRVQHIEDPKCSCEDCSPDLYAIPKRAAEPWIPKSEDDCIDGAPCEHDPPCAQPLHATRNRVPYSERYEHPYYGNPDQMDAYDAGYRAGLEAK